MTVRQAEILLAALISVRASAYLFSKLLLNEMGPFTLMAIRFLLAFVALVIVCRKRLRRMSRIDFLAGTAVGTAFFTTMAFELGALCFSDSSAVSFLENTAIVLVPLGEALLTRALPRARVVASAALALGGVSLLTLGGGVSGLGLGELLGVGAAISYAVAMMVTARVCRQGDALVIGVIQVGWIGAFGGAAAVAFESPSLPATGQSWVYMLILVVVCTVFGFTLQPLAQQHLPVETVGLMCALNPVVAAVLGLVFLSELITPLGALGMVLIASTISLSSTSVGGGRPGRQRHTDIEVNRCAQMRHHSRLQPA